ncbi:MAG: hypothetical protein AAF483_01610 [Planctomycetota bacterium]
MSELIANPTFQAIAALAVLLVAVYVGFQVVMRLRDSTIKADNNVEDLTSNFEEMCLEGDLDEAELREIKTVLGKNQANPSED